MKYNFVVVVLVLFLRLSHDVKSWQYLRIGYVIVFFYLFFLFLIVPPLFPSLVETGEQRLIRLWII